MKDRIKAVRIDKKVTQQAFADQLNVSKSTIEAIEYGRREATDRIIKDICRVYRVSEDWIRTGVGDMYVPLDREAEIAEITAQMFKDNESSFRYQLQLLISQMSEEEIELLREMAKRLAKASNILNDLI